MSENQEKPHYLETLYKELALVLGDAVWAFARIEWITYSQIDSYYSDPVDNLIREINFVERAKILKRLLREKHPDSEGLEEAVKAINKAVKLCERRNLLVHNPWQVWVDLDAKDFMMEIQKYSDATNKLNLNGLHEFIKEAAEIEAELKAALNAL